jgi:hypothetical protein
MLSCCPRSQSKQNFDLSTNLVSLGGVINIIDPNFCHVAQGVSASSTLTYAGAKACTYLVQHNKNMLSCCPRTQGKHKFDKRKNNGSLICVYLGTLGSAINIIYPNSRHVAQGPCASRSFSNVVATVAKKALTLVPWLAQQKLSYHVAQGAKVSNSLT